MNKQKLDECENTCRMLHVSTPALGSTVALFLKTGDCPFLSLMASHLTALPALFTYSSISR